MYERDSYENERAIIHECMNDPQKTEEAIQQLTENDFLNPKHKIIFKAIREITLQNRTPSFIILTEHIENSKEVFDNVAQYLADIDADVLLNTYDDFDYCLETQKSFVESKRQLSILQEAKKMVDNKSNNSDVANYVITSFTKMENRKNSGLVHISEALRMSEEDYKSGKTVGYKTGYPKLDYLTGGFKKGQMIVLGANTGIGKTSLAFSMACNIAKHNSVLYVSREMSASEMANRFIALNTDISMLNMNNCRLSVIDLSKISDLKNTASELYIDNRSSKISDIYSVAMKLKRKPIELGLIVIDYLQLLDYSKYSNNDTQALDRLTREIKVLAMNLEVPILVLSQFNNMASDEHLKLKHLRGSGSISQNADLVLLLDRPENSNEAFLLISKGRNIGKGKIPLLFNGEKTEYLEKDDFFGCG